MKWVDKKGSSKDTLADDLQKGDVILDSKGNKATIENITKKAANDNKDVSITIRNDGKQTTHKYFKTSVLKVWKKPPDKQIRWMILKWIAKRMKIEIKRG
jgi:preprotein translocase subunit YajC